MKYFFLVVSTLVAFLIVADSTSAQSITYKPFGGRVLSTILTGVTCQANPDLVLLSITPPLPYYIINPVGTKKPVINGWILGLYSTIPNSANCRASNAPYPVKTIHPTIFGVSK